MKIEIYEGCTSAGMSVDDRRLEDIDESEVVEYILSKIPDAVNRGEIDLMSLVRLFQSTDYECGSRCEQCGDTPCTTSYDI
jgi:hypothetical protein